MSQHIRAFLRDYRQLMVIGALVLSTFFAVGMFALRASRTHSILYAFLLWNLFLAWLPMIFALTAYNLHKHNARRSWLMVTVSALIWLLFMPNAPYIVTDIVNLSPQPDAPFWYDIVLFATFEWTGLLLGLVSLFLMQEIVRKITGRIVGWVFALGVLGLSSFGIYLGRFLRWNSWDVFLNPRQLLGDILSTLRYPMAHVETYLFSVIFGFFIVCAYVTLVAMTNFRHETVEAVQGYLNADI